MIFDLIKKRFPMSLATMIALVLFSLPAQAGFLDTDTLNHNVIPHPHVYVVHWGQTGNDPFKQAPYLEHFLMGIGGKMWNGLPTEYNGYVPPLSGAMPNTTPLVFIGNDSQIFQGSIYLDNPVPSDTAGEVRTDPITQQPAILVTSDTPDAFGSTVNALVWEHYIQAEVKYAIPRLDADLGVSIENDPNAIVVIAMPPRIHNVGFGASHSNINFTDSSVFSTAYVNLPYQASIAVTHKHVPNPTMVYVRNLISVAMHHELLEALTDPRNSDPAIDLPIRGQRAHSANGYYGWFEEIDTGQNLEIADQEEEAWWSHSMEVKLLNDNYKIDGDPSSTVFAVAPGWSNSLFDGVHRHNPNIDIPDQTAGVNGAALWAHTAVEYKFAVSITGTLLASSGSDNTWTDWGAPFGKTLAASATPQAVAWGPNRIDIFVNLSNGDLGHAWTNNGAGPPAWEDLGPPPETTTFRDPGVVSWGPDHLDVFLVTNNPAVKGGRGLNLWQRRYDGVTGWSGWVSWGHPSQAIFGAAGAITSGPSPTVSFENGVPTLSVFFTAGTSTSAALMEAELPGWDLPNGNVTFSSRILPPAGTVLSTFNPSVVTVTTPFQKNIFLASTRGELMECLIDGLANTDTANIVWTNLGRPPSGVSINQHVGAISYGTQMFKVMVKGTDNSIWRYDTVGGSATWTQFTGLTFQGNTGLGYTTW